MIDTGPSEVGAPGRRVVRPGAEVDVSAASGGVLPESLVHDGDAIDAGFPFTRPHPEVSE